MSADKKVAVVTGAGQGIGKAVAMNLANKGFLVQLCDINVETGEQTAKELREHGFEARFTRVDVTSFESVQQVATSAEQELGPIQAWVNAVGWDIIEPFIENSFDYWDRVIDLNYKSVLFGCRAVLPFMLERKGGKIVNIASDAGRVGSTGEAVYAGAKGGVIAFSKSLAREVARYGICVNVVCPGPTNTPLFHSQPEKMKEALIRAIPMKRLGEPQEVANAVGFFASDTADFITGQVLSVSGGLTMVG